MATLTSPTTVTEFLGDLHGRFDDDGLLAAALPGRGVTTLGARQVLERRVTDAAAAVLDLDLGDLLLDGWTGLRELRGAARRTRDAPGKPEEVPLATHEITSTHHPAVELYVHDALVGTLVFELETTFTLDGVVAQVRDGDLVGVRAGEVGIAARLATGGHEIAARRATCPIGAIVRLGPGVPLVGARDRPGAAPARGRRRRPLLAAVAVLLVLAAAGLVSRVFGSLPSTPAIPPDPPAASAPSEPGTTGVVAEGTAWNVRSGPSNAAPVIAAIVPGEAVRVDCTRGIWARLLDPHEGAFVSEEGLRLDATPPLCPP